MLVSQLCPTLCDPIDCSLQAPLSMGFSRRESWSGLPCPSPGDLPNPGIEPESLTSPALAGRVIGSPGGGSGKGGIGWDLSYDNRRRRRIPGRGAVGTFAELG